MVWEQPKLPKNWVAGEVPGCWSVTGPLPVIIMMIHLGFTGIYWYNLMLSWMLAFFFWLLRIFRAAWLHLPHLQFLAWFGPRKVHKICSFFLTNLHETSFWQIQIMISRYYTYFCQTDSFLDICGLCMIPHWPIYFLCFQARFGIFQGGSHWASFHSSPILSMLTKRMARQRLTALTAPPLVLMTESSDRTQEQCFFSFSKYCLSCGQILYIHIDVGTSSDSKNIHGIVGWFHASDTQKHSATQVFGGRTGSQWKLWLSYQAWLETNIYMFNRCHRCAVYILYLSTSLSLYIYIHIFGLLYVDYIDVHRYMYNTYIYIYCTVLLFFLLFPHFHRCTIPM